MASITYHLIIPNRRSTTSFLIGFGLIIPLTIMYFPFWVLEMLDVRNKLLRFCVGAIYPVLTMFHTSEAIFGFSPHCVESSYKNYLLYYAAGVEVQFDKATNNPAKATSDDKMNSLKSAGSSMLMLGMFKSIFGPSSYEPFQTEANANDPGYHLRDLFDVRLCCNSLICTMLLQLYLR